MKIKTHNGDCDDGEWVFGDVWEKFALVGPFCTWHLLCVLRRLKRKQNFQFLARADVIACVGLIFVQLEAVKKPLSAI